MDRRIKSYLFDIITCIEEIHVFFEGQEINLDSLLGDRKTLRAVERNLEIIVKGKDFFQNLLLIQPTWLGFYHPS